MSRLKKVPTLEVSLVGGCSMASIEALPTPGG